MFYQDVLPTGDYEVVVTQAEEITTKKGSNAIQLTLLVRDDIKSFEPLGGPNSGYEGIAVPLAIWKRRNTGRYNAKDILHLVNALKIPRGTSIDTVDELCRIVIGQTMKVYVKKELDPYWTQRNGFDTYQNTLAPWNLMGSTCGPYADVEKAKDQAIRFMNRGTKVENPFKELLAKGNPFTNEKKEAPKIAADQSNTYKMLADNVGTKQVQDHVLQRPASQSPFNDTNPAHNPF